MGTHETQKEKQFIFAILFSIANKLQKLGDRHLKGSSVTTRQWFLVAVVQRYVRENTSNPTIKECAEMMDTSHQNIRQLTDRLEKHGFVHVLQDKNDRRTFRVELTEKNQYFWESRQKQDTAFIEELFSCMNNKEINTLSRLLGRFEKELQNK